MRSRSRIMRGVAVNAILICPSLLLLFLTWKPKWEIDFKWPFLILLLGLDIIVFFFAFFAVGAVQAGHELRLGHASRLLKRSLKNNV